MHEERGLPLGVAVLDDLIPAGRSTGRGGPGEPVVAGQQVLDLTGDPDPGGDEDDQIVADTFQIGHQVRGDDDAGAIFGGVGHQALQELPAGEGIQARHRFVEDQQLRSLRDGHGQGELGPLADAEPARLLGRVQAQSGDPVFGQLRIPARIGLGPKRR